MSKIEKRLRTLIDGCRVSPGKRVRVKDYDPVWGGKKHLKKYRKRDLEELLTEDVTRLMQTQELLYAADSWSVLIVFQGMDACGKDSTIKHVMSGLNPQGCQVHSFKHPSAEELDHTFLWRCMKTLPERGRIGIFNRSYYEEVLIAKVHTDLVEAEHIPDAKVNKEFWQARYDDINQFERHLVRNGTLILKFFLHVSREEQRKRFLERVNDPAKHWKFQLSDIEERNFWNAYIDVYEDCLGRTSTNWAPWYIIPADHKPMTRTLVASVVAQAIDGLKLEYPEVTKEQRKLIKSAKARLEREKR